MAKYHREGEIRQERLVELVNKIKKDMTKKQRV